MLTSDKNNPDVIEGFEKNIIAFLSIVHSLTSSHTPGKFSDFPAVDWTEKSEPWSSRIPSVSLNFFDEI